MSSGPAGLNPFTVSRRDGRGAGADHPGESDDAIKAVIVSPAFEGGETLVAIRMGSQIVTTLDSSSGKDLGSPAAG